MAGGARSGIKKKRRVPFTEKEREQRRAAASKSRPNRGAHLSEQEVAERDEANRLARGLRLRVVKLVADRVALTERIQERVREELAQDSPDFEAIAEMQNPALTNMDLNALVGQLEDRYGQPRRTEQDHKFEGLTVSPIVLAEEGQREEWGKKEDEHAQGATAPRKPPRAIG